MKCRVFGRVRKISKNNIEETFSKTVYFELILAISEVYPVSKSSMTSRYCLKLADLFSLLSSLYFLKHPYLPKEPHKSCPLHNPLP